jgi:hypothetical protein
MRPRGEHEPRGRAAHDAHTSGVISMRTEQLELLASQRTRSALQEAEQLRHARRVASLRRARRLELKAERRMVEAWRRAAQLRGAMEVAE